MTIISVNFLIDRVQPDLFLGFSYFTEEITTPEITQSIEHKHFELFFINQIIISSEILIDKVSSGLQDQVAQTILPCSKIEKRNKHPSWVRKYFPHI
jgi:hypothetical protein